MSESIKTKSSVLPRKRLRAVDGPSSKAAQVILDHKNNASSESAETEKTSEKVESSIDKKAKADYSKLTKELDKIFSGDNFRGIVRAPADLMLAASGRRIWDIPEKEVQPAADLAAICAKGFVKTDAKWVAVILLSFSLMTMYGGRAGLHFSEVREEKKKLAKTPAPILNSSKENA